MMRVLDTITGIVHDWPDQFAAYHMNRRPDIYQDADKKTAKKSGTSRRSTSSGAASDTVTGDSSGDAAPDQES